MSRTTLLTGSSGFLGRYLLKYSPPDDQKIIAHYRTEPPAHYGRDVQFVQLDFLEDDWSALETLRPELIIHTAAMAAIDECEVKPEISHHINFEATRRLTDLAAERQARFIFISSDVVFDGSKGQYREDDLPNPQSVYANSKLQAENYVLEHLPDAVVLRPSVFYGLTLNGRPSFTQTMLRNLHEGKQVFLFTDQFRSPLLVNNLAEATWEIADMDFNGILHMGGPERMSRMEMGEVLCDLFKLDRSLLVPIQSAQANLIAPRPLDCSLNSSLAHQLLKTNLVDCRTGFSIAFR